MPLASAEPCCKQRPLRLGPLFLPARLLAGPPSPLRATATPLLRGFSGNSVGQWGLSFPSCSLFLTGCQKMPEKSPCLKVHIQTR